MVKLSQALTKSWSTIIIWMLFAIPSCVLSIEDGHKNCTSWFRCGNHTYLNYPFWTPERGEECGHPDFKVNCDGDFAQFSVKTVKFRILAMNNESDIVRLARMDYLDNVCPEYPENATINKHVFTFPPDTQLESFYYDCPGPSIDSLPVGYITKLHCDDDELGPSYFVSSSSDSQNKPILDGLSGSCDRYVNIPVSQSALIKTADQNHSREAVKMALDEGFEVIVNRDCSGCNRSWGACGHFCPKKVLSNEAKIGLGFAFAFFGASLIIGLYYLRKKLGAPYTSQSIPITPYASSKVSLSTPPASTMVLRTKHSFVPSISTLTNESVYSGVQVFSYEELVHATENFSKILGGGGFGVVYYGILKDGRAVAVKRLFERSLDSMEQFKNEIEILKSLKHPNLVILYGCTTRRSIELLLVYEYISNGTLADHLHGNKARSRPLSWPARLKIAIETASALSYLHTSGIIHRDVKSNNILLDSNYQAKVADFGLSRLFRTDQTHVSTAPQGTPGYVDPEYYQCYCLTEKSDVYSFGVVLAELISSKVAVDTTRHRHDINLSNMAITRIQNNAVQELADLSLGFARDPAVKKMMMRAAQLAFRCLQQQSEVRPSMDEIVKVLRGIQKKGIREKLEVNGVDVERRRHVGLLKLSVPPPLSPVTDKGTTSSSNKTASSF